MDAEATPGAKLRVRLPVIVEAAKGAGIWKHTDRIAVSPIKRVVKKKPVGPEGRIWFFQKLLDAWMVKFQTKNLAIVELKFGRVYAQTACFALEPEEAVALSTQMRGLTQKTVKLAGVRYRVYHHNPRSRLVGQVNADPYDKIGSNTGFFAVQADRDHGAMVVGTYDPSIPSTDCEHCCKELAEFLFHEGLVRNSCDRYGSDHTIDCPCLVNPQSLDVSLRAPGLGFFRT